jgi:hypothetical protein
MTPLTALYYLRIIAATILILLATVTICRSFLEVALEHVVVAGLLGLVIFQAEMI